MPRLIASGLLFLSWLPSLEAQSSLAPRVLVVYDSSSTNSSSVASYYQAQRGVPNSNMCPVALGIHTTDLTLNLSLYTSLFKVPVSNCLNAAGPQNILYLVLAYMRPYAIQYSTFNNSIDSYLADIWDQYTTQTFTVPTETHPYYVETQSEGNVYTPFQSLAAYRALGRYALIYSVWRLDGATAAIAEGLVDKALAGEAAGGPISQVQVAAPNACIDMRTDVTLGGVVDVGYGAADWELWRASQFLAASGAFGVVADTNYVTFGTAPAPLQCLNTGLYMGWYNYNSYNANDPFSWDTGSIGWDLDSAGLMDPRQGGAWSAVALRKGIAITSGSVEEPYLEGIPRPVESCMT